jgi:hypothetical protein
MPTCSSSKLYTAVARGSTFAPPPCALDIRKTTLVAPLENTRQTEDVKGEKENTHKVFPASTKAAKVAESISAGSTFTGAGKGQEIWSRHRGGGNVDRRA